MIYYNGSTGNNTCDIFTVHDDSYNPHLPIIIGAVILIVILLFWQLIYYLYRYG